MTKIGQFFVWFWANHVQKTLATMLAGSAVFDLMNALLQYETDLSHILGPHLYHGLRATCALVILARAVIRPHKDQE